MTPSRSLSIYLFLSFISLYLSFYLSLFLTLSFYPLSLSIYHSIFLSISQSLSLSLFLLFVFSSSVSLFLSISLTLKHLLLLSLAQGFLIHIHTQKRLASSWFMIQDQALGWTTFFEAKKLIQFWEKVWEEEIFLFLAKYRLDILCRDEKTTTTSTTTGGYFFKWAISGLFLWQE